MRCHLGIAWGPLGVNEFMRMIQKKRPSVISVRGGALFYSLTFFARLSFFKKKRSRASRLH